MIHFQNKNTVVTIKHNQLGHETCKICFDKNKNISKLCSD